MCKYDTFLLWPHPRREEEKTRKDDVKHCNILQTYEEKLFTEDE